MLDERAKTIALAIVHIFETGRPLGDYGAVAVLTDGAGFSVGTSQFTHKSGSLALVLDRYTQLGGVLNDALVAAMPDFRSGRNIAKRSSDAGLRSSLLHLGPDPLWQQAQREIAFEKYLSPAIDACEGSNFTLPLSLAVIYDSENQGSYDHVRDVDMASPDHEQAWITEYCHQRESFLGHSRKAIVRSTVYRPQFFLGEIKKANWDLNLPLVVNGHRLTEQILFPIPTSAAVLKEQTPGAPTEDLDSEVSETGVPTSSVQPPATAAEATVAAAVASTEQPSFVDRWIQKGKGWQGRVTDLLSFKQTLTPSTGVKMPSSFGTKLLTFTHAFGGKAMLILGMFFGHWQWILAGLVLVIVAAILWNRSRERNTIRAEDPAPAPAPAAVAIAEAVPTGGAS